MHQRSFIMRALAARSAMGVMAVCILWQVPSYADEAVQVTSDVPVMREDSGTYQRPHWIHPQQQACYPRYPAEAQQAGMQGKVSFWLHVDETGKVQSVRLAQSSGHHVLDQATLTAFPNCLFSPALDHGQPVSAWTKLDYVWKLAE